MNGYSLSIVNNGTGADYLCLTDQNGEYAFEPIRMNGGTVYELSEKGFIYMSDKCRFYDYSGNCEELDIDTLNNFNDGLALARSKNSGWFYINTAGERIIG